MEALGSSAEFRRRIRRAASSDASDWSPADFIRASQHSSREFLYGSRSSLENMGALRFYGPGVKGHTLAMRTAGLAMTAWQKLVTDVYAATQGFRNLRGQLPATVQSISALRTHARALPGSVIFDFVYGEQDNGQAHLFSPDMVTRTDPVAETLQFLGAAERSAMSIDAQEFVVVAREMGPRATSSLRAFSELLSTQALDLDAEIYPQFDRARTVKASSEAFKAIVSNIDLGQVLKDEELMEGELLSLSGRKRELEIKPQDGDYVRVAVPDLDLRPFSIGQRVRIYATSEWKTSAMGEATVKYEAQAIENLGRLQ